MAETYEYEFNFPCRNSGYSCNGSIVLWLVTRPRTRSATPSELQKILRGTSQNKPRRMQNPDGIRVIGSEEKLETQIERED